MTQIRHCLVGFGACLILAGLVTAQGCSGCSGRSSGAPDAAPEVTTEAAVEALVELPPEEAPRDEQDAACREALRNHETVLRILGEEPRLTFESEQETIRGNITTYTAETLSRTVRFRVMWTPGAAGPEVTAIDCQHREGAVFQREWTAGG